MSQAATLSAKPDHQRVSIQCPHCSARFKARTDLIGRTVPCGNCHQKLTITPLPPVQTRKPSKPLADKDYQTLIRLFTPTEIGIAAFLAGPLAAGTMLALNFRTTKKYASAVGAAFSSVLAFVCAVVLLVLSGPLGSLVGLAILVGQVLLYSSFARSTWNHQYSIPIPAKYKRTRTNLQAVGIVVGWVLFGLALQLYAIGAAT